ncbi:ribosomal protein L37E, partial [Paenibacillus sacheonensis]|nr:ribosomal protein L37E [Paenibacillus sacheonensis]
MRLAPSGAKRAHALGQRPSASAGMPKESDFGAEHHGSAHRQCQDTGAQLPCCPKREARLCVPPKRKARAYSWPEAKRKRRHAEVERLWCEATRERSSAKPGLERSCHELQARSAAIRSAPAEGSASASSTKCAHALGQRPSASAGMPKESDFGAKHHGSAHRQCRNWSAAAMPLQARSA